MAVRRVQIQCRKMGRLELAARRVVDAPVTHGADR